MDQDRHVERPVPRAREQAVTHVRRAGAVAVLAALVLACASKNAGQPRDPTGVAPPVTATTGTIVELEPGPRVVFALSDVHGGYDRLAALLAAVGLARPAPPSAGAITWAGGDAVLVVAGDLIDKGPQPIEVIDALRALEVSAEASGGRVVVLLGNHEAEFFVNPTNAKADGSDGVDRELAALQIDPGVLAAGTEPRGAWLLARPFGARVGRWFFSHGGSTRGRTVAALDAALRAALAAHPTFDADEIVGGDSILEARDWYADPAVTVANAAALGVDHIVFGHDPNALGARGAIAVAQDTRLLRIDCGMSPTVNDSEGRVLRIRHEGAVEIAEELGVASSRELFRASR